MSTTLTTPEVLDWMHDPGIHPAWLSPCPVWCTSYLLMGQEGHDGDNVPCHRGELGTVILDRIPYAVELSSQGDGPPRVSLFCGPYRTPADLWDITADQFLSLAPVLLSRYEKVLASLYRDMAARVPETVPPVTPDVPVSLAS